MKRNTTLYWRLCCAGAVLLSILTFTPLVIVPGEVGPTLLGLPHTLWAGLLVAIGLVLLTFIGSQVHPARQTGEDMR